MKGCIYKITSIKNRIYIGQTINFKVRIGKYKRLDCKKQRKLYNSFLKHGFESHIIEIIEQCDSVLLNKRERYWQDFYNSANRFGLNIRLTNSLEKTGSFSKESRLKMSKAKIGTKRSKEVCEAISVRMKDLASKRDANYYNNFKGKKQSEAHRKKNSQAKLGNTFRKGSSHTEESKKKMSISRKGKTFSEETKKRMSDKHKLIWAKRKENE